MYTPRRRLLSAASRGACRSGEARAVFRSSQGQRREELAVRAAASLRSARMKLPPYPMIELDLSAPLDLHRATVLPDWIDWNGHMNVGFYVVAFDKATDTLVQPVRLQLGIHARQDRHDLRARGARHLRPRGQGGRSAAHHHARSSTTTPSACTTSTAMYHATKAISPPPTS